MINNSQQPLNQMKDGKANNKKEYHTPIVQRYGNISELVQFRPRSGRDGETFFIDCTRS